MNQKKAGVLLSYGQTALSTLISLTYTPVMLRLLGQSEYGLYTLVSGFVSNLSLLSFGLGSAYMRYYSRAEVKDGEIIVDVYLMVRYGYVIPETARKVQDSVSAAVSGMTGYNVHAVNVHVGGISFN